ncbi:MAG: nucleoside deaminase [Thiohalomonadaceae bacterium]
MSDMEQQQHCMREALALAAQSVRDGGGPFGAVVVRDGVIIGRGSNRVTPDNDPTAHAEVVAIRAACRTLNSFSLEGCELYVNCEPCPMCLAAAYWARLERIYYAATRDDAAAGGFDDALIYREVCLLPEQRRLPLLRLLPEEAGDAFAAWAAKADRVDY